MYNVLAGMFARGRLLVAGSAVALALVLGVAVSGLEDQIIGRGRSGPSVPDTLLLMGSPTNMGPQPALVGIGIFHPETGSFEKVLDYTPTEPLPAPDGRDLFFVQQHQVEDQLRTAIVDLASDTLRPRWSVDILARSVAEARQDPYWPGIQLAATPDRVYVAVHRPQSPEPITIVALDRVDGLERRRWQTGVADQWIRPLQIRVVGTQLYLLAMDVGPPARTMPRPDQQLVLYRFRLPDGVEDAHAVPVQIGVGGAPWPTQPTPDGRGLYALGATYSGHSVAVYFLDLATVSVEKLDLPLVAPRTDWLPYEQGPSADGRHLFVLAPTLGQLVSVDLVNRRVEQVVPIGESLQAALPPTLGGQLWGLLSGLFVQAADAKSPFVGTLQLSPDGSRLYGVGMTADTHESRGAGVVVIDTHQWRLVSRWLPRVEPSQILLSGGGSHLLVQEPPWAAAPTAGAVHVLDATTGTELSVSHPLPRAVLHSVAELYRATYGSSSSASEAPAQPELLPLASLTVTADPPATVAGRPVRIEARFVDPRTGQTVRPELPGVRFDPPTRVTARMLRNSVDDQGVVVTLQPSDFGVYQGSVQLPNTASGSPGNWTLRAEATWPDGLRRVEVQDAVVVRPTFVGTDGRSYALQLTAEGPKPRIDQDIQLRAAFVDAETGAVLPAGVALVEGLPDRVEIACYGQGVTARVFGAVDHGVYAGTVHLWAPGTWRVWATLMRPAGSAPSFVAGSLRVDS